MKNFVQPGHELPFEASATIKSGELVTAGEIVGVAAANYASGAIGIIKIQGVFKLLKNTSEAFTVGQKLYRTTGSQLVTSTASTNKFLGYAWTAQDAADSIAQVLLARPGS